MATRLGLLAIQAGRLLAILRDFIVSSNDFCGEGVDILGGSSRTQCGKLQECNAALSQKTKIAPVTRLPLLKCPPLAYPHLVLA